MAPLRASVLLVVPWGARFVRAPAKMPGAASPRFYARTLKDPFSLRAKRTDVGREVLSGILGWMTVVSSVAFCK